MALTLGGAGLAARWHVSNGLGHGIDGDGLSLGGQLIAGTPSRAAPAPSTFPYPAFYRRPERNIDGFLLLAPVDSGRAHANPLSLCGSTQADAPAMPTHKSFGPRKERAHSHAHASDLSVDHADASRSRFARRITASSFALSQRTRTVRHRQALVACIEIGRDVIEGAYRRALLKCKRLAEFETAARAAQTA